MTTDLYPNGRHILVTGFPRSGTTMFYNMLRTSVEGFIAFDNEIGSHAVIGQDPRSIISKRPLDIFTIDETYKANKYNKTIDTIILVRDIRAIITSVHKSIADDYFIGYDFQYNTPPEGGEAQRTNPGIIPIFHAIGNFVSGNLPGNKIVLRYEDIVLNTAAIQEKLDDQLNLKYSRQFDEFYKADIPPALADPMNGIAPPDSSRIDKWRKPEHKERIQQQFTECPQLFEILKFLQYEKDDSWFEKYS